MGGRSPRRLQGIAAPGDSTVLILGSITRLPLSYFASARTSLEKTFSSEFQVKISRGRKLDIDLSQDGTFLPGGVSSPVRR